MSQALIDAPKREFARNGRGNRPGGNDDFYNTLGVDNNASQSDIKKSYF